MTGWAGFWLMLGMIIVADNVLDYLYWRTKALYKTNKIKRQPWWSSWYRKYE